MKELVIVSANSHKIGEIKAILPASYHLMTLNDLGFKEDIPETGTSFKENAFIKANTIYEKFQKDCFADDSGLIVEALNGEPGVLSARYAGPNASYHDNNMKILSKMQGISNRNASFVCVICLIMDGKPYFFEGSVNGKIIHELKGTKGFGYDPLFIPDGYDKTFAELNPEIKNKISHRSRALAEMIQFLQQKSN